MLYATETTVGTTNESIYVNKAGKRFCDEGGSRTDMTIALMEQDGGVGFQVVDHDSSMITDGKTHTGMDVEYRLSGASSTAPTHLKNWRASGRRRGDIPENCRRLQRDDSYFQRPRIRPIQLRAQCPPG